MLITRASTFAQRIHSPYDDLSKCSLPMKPAPSAPISEEAPVRVYRLAENRFREQNRWIAAIGRCGDRRVRVASASPHRLKTPSITRTTGKQAMIPLRPLFNRLVKKNNSVRPTASFREPEGIASRGLWRMARFEARRISDSVAHRLSPASRHAMKGNRRTSDLFEKSKRRTWMGPQLHSSCRWDESYQPRLDAHTGKVIWVSPPPGR
jgi:hypothetical protein